ncbi:MAG: two pore domain potassium channel family protein [Salinivirgaceae bacterium]|nr:two pore domain potassium channel family protein [Salinivirgaceae bacterium]
MINLYFETFDAKILDKPFTNNSGKNYPLTAVLTFYDIRGKILFASEYGHKKTEQIYQEIEQDKTIDLDNCYVHNFSMSAYLRSRILEKKSTVELNSISTVGAFFYSDFIVDFSHLKIAEGKVDFANVYFYSDDLSFAHTNFGDGEVDFSYCFFRSKKIDFSNSIFGEGDVFFKNSIFRESEKNFQYTDFGIGELNFVNTDFGNGDVIFLNTNFNDGDVSFKVARFGNGKVDFHYSHFGGGNISFERTNFGEGDIDFRTVEFNRGKVNFNRSVFGNGEANFEAIQAKGRITFKKAKFGAGNVNFELAELEQSEINFEKADFGNSNISFRNASFKSLILNGCHLDQYCDLRVNSCPYVDLSDTIVRDIVDFKPHKTNVKIDVLNISGMRLLGTVYIDWKENNVLDIISNQHNTSFSEKANQFRTLKESFNITGQYNNEDYSYIWFKRFEMKAEYHQAIEKNKWAAIYYAPVVFFKKLLFDWMGLYATDPFRVMLSMIATYVLFSLVYVFVLLTKIGNIVSGLGGDHDLLNVVGRSFYHSGVTFLTIGYGDFYPMGAIRWLSNVEGFIGVFLMSYFTVAFVRKILR